MLEIRQDLEQSIRDKVNSGAFNSADALLEHALSLLDEQTDWLDRNRNTLENSLADGQQQLPEPMTDADWQYLKNSIANNNSSV
jgi:Arc/MetJ-type ribon-helix-helix transcriptional regulator